MIEVIENWTEEIETDLIKSYKEKGFKASGDYEKKLSNSITETKTGAKITFKGAKQAYWMENGRKPNKKNTEKELKAWVGWAGSTFLADWVVDKGIIANPFAIAWGIARKGYSVSSRKGVISDVINTESVRKLARQVSGAYIKDIKSDIKKIWR